MPRCHFVEFFLELVNGAPFLENEISDGTRRFVGVTVLGWRPHAFPVESMVEHLPITDQFASPRASNHRLAHRKAMQTDLPGVAKNAGVSCVLDDIFNCHVCKWRALHKAIQLNHVRHMVLHNHFVSRAGVMRANPTIQSHSVRFAVPCHSDSPKSHGRCMVPGRRGHTAKAPVQKDPLDRCAELQDRSNQSDMREGLKTSSNFSTSKHTSSSPKILGFIAWLSQCLGSNSSYSCRANTNASGRS